MTRYLEPRCTVHAPATVFLPRILFGEDLTHVALEGVEDGGALEIEIFRRVVGMRSRFIHADEANDIIVGLAMGV